ncbi:hydantoinase B/oxoprolinase family protein [Deferribacter autotrophicus]|uniref:Hydantoinase B/oxoprolinase family protein n=1 Tax=Deferribacter autotrophicus TaxID=500465 RepID=A0A5A8EZN4_9BACT|nr:hydantoinase B/oxoprolinase family protein [Deferribacter autotrophicus]KAA0256992.1 hydantoinase B/oxoprolinase family protein [Deferribacter autotrophicus]
MKINPILLEVFKNRFVSISEEMGVTLNRTAFSPNIKERRDFSCAIFDENGDMIAQAAHIPVHLGSMPMSVKSAIENVDLKDGDMVILNDPYKGGTHLPDVTIVAPVFLGQEKPQFFVANRAHHADIGGMTAGSMPLSTSIFQEGLIIPPLKIVEKGEIVEPLMKFLLNNVRTPYEREGDFTAQIMANMTGIKRIEELVAGYGLDMVKNYATAIMDYSEKILKSRLKDIPNGTYKFEDYMDDDGIDREKIKIAVQITVDDDNVVVDFSETDDQVKGSVNAVYSITLSAVLYVFRSLVKDEIPTNAGLLRPIILKTRKGSIVDAKFPASVAGGNVETSQRIVDVLLGALSKALPNEIPAASQGTMNNITIGGIDERNDQPFTYYETIGGGMGGCSFANGESAVHSHMTNTLNTPVEALEFTYPMMVEEYSIRKDSGGKGRFKGGDGIVRQIRLLNDAEVTMLTERRRFSPYGLNGGEPGKSGENIIISNGEKKKMPGKFNINLKKGDIIRIETPGGGGFGKSEV